MSGGGSGALLRLCALVDEEHAEEEREEEGAAQPRQVEQRVLVGWEEREVCRAAVSEPRGGDH